MSIPLSRVKKYFRKLVGVEYEVFFAVFFLAVFVGFFVPNLASAVTGDWRFFYGISWRGSSINNIKYARQMGYKYIFDKGDYKNYSEASGMRFYIESPEYHVYNRVLNTKSYTSQEKSDFERLAAWKSTAPFPGNIATGWMWGTDATRFSTEPDWQQQAVIDEIVEKIIAQAKSQENPSINYRAAGFAWDVPQLTGDFWNKPQALGGSQVSLSYWTGSDSSVLHPGITHEYATYSDGKAAYYKKLFQRAREELPEAHFIMEPSTIYGWWIKQISGRSDKTALTPSDMMLVQEESGTEFIDDSRIYNAGLGITKDRVGTTEPNSFGTYENRIFAGIAGVNGSWFNWFGRFGMTGDMPNYADPSEVPARLQFVRVIPGWDNLIGVPLNQRSWNGDTYSSPNSRISSHLMYSRFPGESNKVFAVFLDTSEGIQLNSGESVSAIYRTDNLFIESTRGDSDVNISNGKIFLNSSSNTGKGYIILTTGGGGSGCTPNWQCSSWSTCSGGQQARSCSDSNGCGTTNGQPVTTQACGSTGCNALSFISGSVSPISVAPGGTYFLKCDYGSVVDSVETMPGSGDCTFVDFSGTAADFSCTAGTTSGTFANSCSLVSGKYSNTCAREDSINSLVVTSAPSQACGDGTCSGTETCSTCPGDCGACPTSAKTYNLTNFTNLVKDWLKSMTGSPADVNSDGKVNSKDLGIMMDNWAL